MTCRTTPRLIRAGASFNDFGGTIMAVEMCDVEVWVMVDANGNYEAGVNEEHATDAYTSAFDDQRPRRLVKIVVKVPLPLPLEVTGAVAAPDERAELVGG